MHGTIKWLFAVLLLSILSSCKSKQIATTQETDSTSVHTLVCKDSLRFDYNFQFDRLDVYYYDTLSYDTSHKRQPNLLKHVAITKGSTSSAIVRTEEKATCDSTKVDSMKYEEPIPKPPKKSTCFWLIALLIGLIILIIMSRYK